MEDLFSNCDKLGPYKIIHVHEPNINLKAVLVIDIIAKGAVDWRCAHGRRC